MKDVVDLIPQTESNTYRYEKLNPDGTGTGEFVYLKYAPGELQEQATAVNRGLFMSVQGFDASDIEFNSDGSITETYDTGTKTTVFNSDGSITETFAGASGRSIAKTTLFNEDGSIQEVIT